MTTSHSGKNITKCSLGMWFTCLCWSSSKDCYQLLWSNFASVWKTKCQSLHNPWRKVLGPIVLNLWSIDPDHYGLIFRQFWILTKQIQFICDILKSLPLFFKLSWNSHTNKVFLIFSWVLNKKKTYELPKF